MNISLIILLVLTLIIQFIALSPLLINIQNIILRFFFSASALILTLGFTYIIHSLLGKFIMDQITFSLFLTLIFEFLILKLFTYKIDKKYLSYLKVQNLELVIIFFISIIFYFFIKSKLNYDKNSDLARIFQLLDDVVNLEQTLFSYTYYDPVAQLAVLGNFYPWAGFILSALIYELGILVPQKAVFSIVEIFSLVIYPITFFLLLLVLNFKYRILAISLLLLANMFPLGMLEATNFAQIYGTLASLSSLVFYFYLRPHRLLKKLYLIFLLAALTFFIHPSSMISFLLLLFFIELIFVSKLNLFTFLKSYLHYLIFIFLIFYVLVLILFYSELIAFFDSIPISNPAFTLSTFFKYATFSTILTSFLPYLVFLSDYYIFPLLTFTFTVIFIRCLIQRNFVYLIPFIVYYILIISALISGIEEFAIFSFFSFFYYQSPIRIVHIGIFVSILFIPTSISFLRERLSLIDWVGRIHRIGSCR
jgi:hypothetical protein